jgi:hypothetical protein
MQPMEASIAAEASGGAVPQVEPITLFDQKTRTQVQFISRLNPEVYKKFEESLFPPALDHKAVDAGVDAAFRLGIQYTLKKLREGFVTE